MSAVLVGFFSIVLMCVLIFGGMHIAFALALCSFAGVWLIKGDFSIALNLLGTSAVESIATYDFAVVPLFVLAGALVGVADLATDAFRAASQVLRRTKGGVAIATVLGNAVLSAVTGVTIASVAIFTKLAVPQMLKLGYRPRFAVGVVAGSGVLGMLIPPSLLMIVYCFLTDSSVGKIFIASVVPGVLLTLMLGVGVWLMAHWLPGFVGEAQNDAGSERMSGWQVLKGAAPITALLLLIFGGIYGGVFTATEAGATSALMALLFAIGRRRLTAASTWLVIRESGTITVAILLLIVAAMMYSRMLALSGLPEWFTGQLASARMGYWVLLASYVFLLFFLGTFLDSMSTILLSVPLMWPVFQGYGADVYWFGIVTILATEMGIVTPPLGISAFVVKSTLNDPSISLSDIYVGSYPFLGVMLFALILIIVFPGITAVLI